MALSYVQYPGNGSTKAFDVTFGYLSRSHVFVFLDNELTAYSWTSPTRIELASAPTEEQTVTIRRLTDRVNRVTTFADGQTLLSGDLNAGDLQVFYIAQEMLDQVTDGILSGVIVVNDPGSGYITEQWIQDQLQASIAGSVPLAELQAAILQEALDRAADVDAEATARAAALTSEAAARAAAIAAEASARADAVLALNAADTALDGRLDVVEADINTAGTGLKAKVATLTTATTDLAANKADASVVTAIDAKIETPTTGLKARATSLESRMSTVETDKASVSSVSAIDAKIETPTTGLKARATSLESRMSTVESGKASTTVTDAIDAKIETPTTGLKARATSLESRMTSVETGKASTTVTDAIDAKIETPTTGLKARATSLESRMTTVETNKAEATALAAVSAALESDGTNLVRNSTFRSGLTFWSNAGGTVPPVAYIEDAGIAKNGRFQDVFSGTAYAPSWEFWSVGGQGTQVTGDGQPYAYRVTSGAGASDGFRQTTANGTVKRNKKYRLRVRAKLVSGSWDGCAIVCPWLDTGENVQGTSLTYYFASTPDINNVTSNSATGLRTWEFVVTSPDTAAISRIRFIPLNHFASAGSIAVSNTIDWHEIDLIPLEGNGVNSYLALLTTAYGGAYSDLIPVTPGARYYLAGELFRPSTSHSVRLWVQWFKDNGTVGIADYAIIALGPVGSHSTYGPNYTAGTGWQEFKFDLAFTGTGSGKLVAPAGATHARVYVDNYAAYPGFGEVRARRIRFGIGNYAPPWSEGQIADVSLLMRSMVTNNSAEARLMLKVNTSTNVATIEAVALGGNDGTWNGSAIRLDATLIQLLARSIQFGANTTFEDTYNTFYTTASSRRNRWGGPFGASGDLLEWFGPSSVALNSETRSNGYTCKTTDGEYYRSGVILQTLYAVPSPASQYCSGSRTGAGSVTTTTASISSVLGGNGSYTYSWDYVSGDTFTINSPGSASTTASTSLTSGQSKSGLYTCTVTDVATGRVTKVPFTFFASSIV